MRRFMFSLALALMVSTSASAQSEHLWVFGDSLSDTGNLSLLFATDGNPDTYLPAAYTPYSPAPGLTLQRISNGKTTIEYIADHYGDSLLPSFLRGQVPEGAANNFAIFGARAALTSGLDLPYQVAQLAERVQAGVDVSSDRAVIAIGSNDVFAAWGAAIEPLQSGGEIDMDAGRAILDEAVASIRRHVFDAGFATIPSPAGDGSTVDIPSLVAMGMSKFLVLNSPDIGTTPWVANTADAFGDVRVKKAAKRLTRYFNRKLRRLVDDMEDAELDVVSIDLRRIASGVRRQYRWLGFENRNDDCFLTNTLATLTDGTAPEPAVYRDTCSEELADTFMFLDTAHPTGSVHAITGRRVVRRLQECRPY